MKDRVATPAITGCNYAKEKKEANKDWHLSITKTSEQMIENITLMKDAWIF